MPRPRIRLLIGDSIALGPGKSRLLEAIGDTGSIAAAARAPGAILTRRVTRDRAIEGPGWIVHIAPTLIVGTGALPSNWGAVHSAVKLWRAGC